VTQIIDGSMVYGSNDDTAKFLRTFKRCFVDRLSQFVIKFFSFIHKRIFSKKKIAGKLRISTVNEMEFMPFDTQNRSDLCFILPNQMPQFQCFVGGTN
jgi:hypothetical protein